MPKEMPVASIQSIHGVEVTREGEFPLYYKVGVDGVTRIDEDSYSPEPYCCRILYYVYKGSQLHARVSDAAVGVVIYTETDHEQD